MPVVVAEYHHEDGIRFFVEEDVIGESRQAESQQADWVEGEVTVDWLRSWRMPRQTLSEDIGQMVFLDFLPGPGLRRGSSERGLGDDLTCRPV